MSGSVASEYLAFASALRDGTRLSPKATSTVLMQAKEANASDNDLLGWYAAMFPANAPITTELFNAAKKRIENTCNLGIHCLPITEADYPNALRKIENPPPVLYVRGSLDILSRTPGLAVVGTRKATRNGIKIAERIAAHFSQFNWPIVSGLALGIDAAAHRGALTGAGGTIAVLAHGLEAAYPRTNMNLASEILERGGAWVSEYPVGVPAKPDQFVARNRIQIGLSAGSVIVEGEVQSGSITQAEYCLRNSRVLFAVIEDPNGVNLGLLSDGTNMLVEKRGAHPIFSKDDYENVAHMLAQKRAALIDAEALRFAI